MNVVKSIFDRIVGKSKREIAAYNAKIAAETQAHWENNTIAIKELVYERWNRIQEEGNEAQEKYNYVVFIDIGGDLDWICGDDHSQQKLKTESSTLIVRAQSLEATPCKHLQEEEWMAFKRILGAAIVSALEESYPEAESLITQAKSYIEQRIPERSRLWTLWSATIALILSGCVLYWLRSSIFATPLVFGMFGAYVSLVKHASMRKVDSSAGRMLHVTEAVVRLLIGALLGKLGVLFFDCSLAPEFARHVCDLDSGVRVIAFAAGLFDAFIPAMISAYVIAPMKSEGVSHV